MIDSASSVVICSLHHLDDSLRRYEPAFVVSILSDREREQFRAPAFQNRHVLDLRFDDVAVHSSAGGLAPGHRHIESLIEFARTEWQGRGSLLCHCRAGVARSSAAGLIAVAVFRHDDLAFLARVARAKAYFKPNATMLRVADDLLGTSLVELVRGLPPSDRQDEWGPVHIALDG